MDFFDDAFQWHPRFLPPIVQPHGLLLVSELDFFMLDAPAVRALVPVLCDRASLASHCRSAGAPALLAEMLHALEAMARQGVVQPVAGEGGVRYRVPDFTRAPLEVRVQVRVQGRMEERVEERVDAIVLSGVVSQEMAMRWSQSIPACEGGLTLVFSDDLLDPRLGPIDRRLRARRRPWLLVKPTGEQASAGPLFAPPAGQGAAACWHCLAHRLRRNRPARGWLEAQQGGPLPGFPVRDDAGLAERRLAALLPLARDIVARAAPELWTLDPAAPHPVSVRPQCPHCGDPSLMARQQRAPIALARCLAGPAADGGWRSAPAAATLARLAPHVDPLCGIVTQVAPIGAGVEGALTVYRSEIFRTPPVDGDLSASAWVQVCLGKGMSDEQSRASALGEAIERHAAFWQGDEACVVATAAALDGPCIAPQALALFSERQRANFGRRRPPHAVEAPPSSAEGPSWWTPAWSLTARARCYLPLAFCHANAPAESQRHVSWTSNGCAAGNTREEAILQGLLELVERDAAAIWWYGRIRRPAIALDGLLDEDRRARIERTLGTPWRFHVLDITHDFGIPVAAAIGRHRATGQWAVGFGCSADGALACERALTEMAQLIAAGKQFAVPQEDEEAGRGGVPSFLLPLGAEGGHASPQRRAVTDIAEEIERCVAVAASLGLQTVVLDCSRPDIPLHVVKVVVPGLCHIWPELGNPRLYRVPVALGWRDVPLHESELNPQALYV